MDTIQAHSVNGYFVAGNKYVAIAINESDPEDARCFLQSAWKDDPCKGAYERAVQWTSPGV